MQLLPVFQWNANIGAAVKGFHRAIKVSNQLKLKYRDYPSGHDLMMSPLEAESFLWPVTGEEEIEA